MPNCLSKLAALEYQEDITVPDQHEELKYPKSVYVTEDLFLDSIKVYCDRANMQGIRGGDIITSRRRYSRWHKKKIFVEGYDERGKLWGREISDQGTLTREVSNFYGRAKDLKVIKKRGQYVPFKKYHFDPTCPYGREFNKSSSTYRLITNPERCKKAFQEARDSAKRAPDFDPYGLENVFEQSIAVLMRGELIDLIRRIHNVFPLKNPNLIIKQLEACTTKEQVQEINEQFITNLRTYLQGEYTDAQIVEISDAIAENREAFDLKEVLKNIINWIGASLHRKIGIICQTKLSEENPIEDFPRAINEILQEVTEHITPVLIGDPKHINSLMLFSRKPAYFQYLLESYGLIQNYDDVIFAAKHIVGICLNGAVDMIDRQITYDLKHVTDQEGDTNLGHPIHEKVLTKLNEPSFRNLSLTSQLLHFDRDIYTVYPFAPPSSSGGHVLRLEISTGCNYGKCTYCSLYENEDFSLTNFDQFRRHVDMIRDYVGEDIFEYRFRRIFLSGGNGLSMPTNRLAAILRYIGAIKRFSDRTESYATTAAILRHGKNGLQDLSDAGLDLVYWGIESCNDDVLALANKGFTQEDIIKAGEMLNKALIRASITVMPGLGGTKHMEAHAQDTTTIIAQELLPEYLTLMAVHAPNTQYSQDIEEAEDNRDLTEAELIAQMQKMRELFEQITESLPMSQRVSTRIAAHDPETTPACFNPTHFTDKY